MVQQQPGILEWLTMLGEWAIVSAILYEGYVALKEYRSARLFEAIKYLEDSETREARKIIYQELVRSSPKSKQWWNNNKRLSDAAATVCARYNLVGAVSKDDKKLRKFIVKEWAYNICATYEPLKEYLRHREENRGQAGAFNRYRELYDEAREAKKI